MRAAASGRAAGLRYVYAGNLPGQVGDIGLGLERAAPPRACIKVKPQRCCATMTPLVVLTRLARRLAHHFCAWPYSFVKKQSKCRIWIAFSDIRGRRKKHGLEVVVY